MLGLAMDYRFVIILMRVDTRGLGTPASHHNIFDSEKLNSQMFLVLMVGFEPQVFGSWVRHYQVSLLGDEVAQLVERRT